MPTERAVPIAEDLLDVVIERLEYGIKDKGMPPEEELKSYVCKIAKNAAIDKLKKNVHSFESVELTAEIVDKIKGHDTDILEWICSMETQEEIAKELMELPKIYREVFVLKVNHGLSNDKIAQMLNIRHDTVRQRYHRARKKLLNSKGIQGLRRDMDA